MQISQFLCGLFQWKKALRLERKKQRERTRKIRKSPRSKDMKVYYKESTSEEEVKKKPKVKSPVRSPKGKKVHFISLEWPFDLH